MDRLPTCLRDLVTDYLRGNREHWRATHERVLCHIDDVADTAVYAMPFGAAACRVSKSRLMFECASIPPIYLIDHKAFRVYLRAADLPIAWDTKEEDACIHAMTPWPEFRPKESEEASRH